MNKIKKLPKFKTIAEEARFWDSHDVSDYLPEMRRVDVAFERPVLKEEMITIRIQSAIKEKLENVAKNYGVDLSSLLRIWLVDRLKQSEYSRLSG